MVVGAVVRGNGQVMVADAVAPTLSPHLIVLPYNVAATIGCRCQPFSLSPPASRLASASRVRKESPR